MTKMVSLHLQASYKPYFDFIALMWKGILFLTPQNLKELMLVLNLGKHKVATLAWLAWRWGVFAEGKGGGVNLCVCVTTSRWSSPSIKV